MLVCLCGLLVLSTVSVQAQGKYKSVGCFIDKKNLYLRDFKFNPKVDKKMTVDFCHSFCSAKRFKFFALQFGTECRCGNTYARIKNLHKKAGGCFSKCPGNPRQVCGGRERNSVYQVLNVQPKEEPKKVQKPITFMGCFQDSNRNEPNYRDFKFRVKLDGNSHEKCNQACLNKGFKYFAVQFGSECRCGNAFARIKSMHRKLAEKDCNMPCSGNKNQKCGGKLRNGVYSTSGTAQKPVKEAVKRTKKFEGCFQDSKKPGHRDFNFRASLLVSNTHHACNKACNDKGYKYFALQFGSECRCGNALSRIPRLHKRVSPKMCDMPCPGNKQTKCGGNLTNLVFSTYDY